MQKAKDFKFSSKLALSGRWGLALVTGLVASLLGGTAYSIGSGFSFNFNFNVDTSEINTGDVSFDTTFSALMDEIMEILPALLVFMGIILITALITSVVTFVLGSIVEVGYSRFNLNLADYGPAAFRNLFEYFVSWKRVLLANFLRQLFISLWSLLFIVPGVIAFYNYAMVPYILAEEPETAAKEALNKSKAMMYGNRWRLFCLRFSFIGWDILNVFTFGIGSLWLTPYKSAAYACFYRDVSGTGKDYMPSPEPVQY